MSGNNDWYCPRCEMFVSGHSVTSDETHVICGTTVLAGGKMVDLAQENARLRAELAAIKARRCKTCTHGSPDVAAGHYLCWLYKPALQTRYNHSCPLYDPKEGDADG